MAERVYRVAGRDSERDKIRSRQALAALEAREEGFRHILVPLDALDDTETLLPRTLGPRARIRAELGVIFRALGSDKLDLAVAAVSDLNWELPGSLVLAAVLPRQDARNVLAIPRGKSFQNLDPLSRIYVSGERERLQLQQLRPDLRPADPDTLTLAEQAEAVRSGAVDGAILPAAEMLYEGIDRWRSELTFRPFAPDALIPRPGAGFTAVICRRDDREARQLLNEYLEDETARASFNAERFMSQALGLGPDRPELAASVHVYEEDGRLILLAMNQADEDEKPLWLRHTVSPPGRMAADTASLEAALHSLMGRLSFVGAGPGLTDLISLKGARRIREAAAVFYEPETGPLAREHAGPDTRLVEAGAGENLTEQMLAEIRRGRMAVRLVAGDPFFLGQASREARELRSRMVPIEVVPGISAASAWPAFAGMALSDEQLTDHVHFFDGRFPHDPSLKNLLQVLRGLAGEGTLVFNRAARRLPDIAAVLQQAGWHASIPAAAVIRGGEGHQGVLYGKVSDIAARAVAANLKDPAVLIVGEAVRLSEDLSWWPPLGPLTGLDILYLETKVLEARADALPDLLRQQGAAVSSLTLGEEVLDSSLDEELDRELASALERRQSGRRFERSDLWLVLNGVSAVRAFTRALRRLRVDHRLLAPIHLAVSSDAAAAALLDSGFDADWQPPSDDMDVLAAHLADQLSASDYVLGLGFGPRDSVLSLVMQLAGVPSLSLPASRWDVRPDLPRFRELLDRSGNIILRDAEAARIFTNLLASDGISPDDLLMDGKRIFPASHGASLVCVQAGIPVAGEPGDFSDSGIAAWLEAAGVPDDGLESVSDLNESTRPDEEADADYPDDFDSDTASDPEDGESLRELGPEY